MIDPALARFLEEGLGIHIGTRNHRLQPNGARVAAVRVEDAGSHLLAYVPAIAAARVLPDLEANGLAAVMFARPVDDRACQLKGTFVSARDVTEEERAFVRAQWTAFLENLERIGIPRQATDGWVTWPSVAVRLKVTAVFNQTPGPDAGAQLS